MKLFEMSEVVQMTLHGVVELWCEDKSGIFLINEKRIKYYRAEHEDR